MKKWTLINPDNRLREAVITQIDTDRFWASFIFGTSFYAEGFKTVRAAKNCIGRIARTGNKWKEETLPSLIVK